MSKRKIAYISGGILLAPVVLVVLLAVALYLPPVQRWAVDKACAWAEEETGYRVKIGEVRLAFPLDLRLGEVTARDNVGDTLLLCDELTLSVPVRPLFDCRVDVDGFKLSQAYINTKGLIGDTHFKGSVGRMEATTHGFQWKNNRIDGLKALMNDADLLVWLTDTAKKDTTPSAPWFIDIARADINHSRIRFALPGETETVDLLTSKTTALGGSIDTGKELYSLKDLSLLSSDLRLTLPGDTTTATLVLSKATAREAYADLKAPRYGLTNLNLQTTKLRYADIGYNNALGLQLDSVSYANDKLTAAAKVHTDHSQLQAGIILPVNALSHGTPDRLTVWADGTLHPLDVKQIAGKALPREYADLIPNEPLALYAKVSGNMADLKVHDLRMQMPSLARLTASGNLKDIAEDWRRGEIKLDMTTASGIGNIVKHFAGDAVRIPSGTHLSGTTSFKGLDDFTGNLRLQAAGGDANVKGHVNLKGEDYNLTASTRHLPLNAFVPGLATTPLTATIEAMGHRFNPLEKGSTLHAKANIRSLRYDVYPLDNTRLVADVKSGQANVKFNMQNRMMQGDGLLQADLNDFGKPGSEMACFADACIDEFNPRAIGLMEDTLTVGATFRATLRASSDFKRISCQGSLADICFISSDTLARARDLTYDIALRPDLTHALINSGDLNVSLEAPDDISHIISKGQSFYDELMDEMSRKEIDQPRLTGMLPTLQLNVEAAESNNPLTAFAKMKGYTLRGLSMNLNSSPADGLSGWARTGRFDVGSLQLDTIYVDLSQDSTGVRLAACVDNFRKENPNRFTATLDGYALSSGAGADLHFMDEKGKTGVKLGVQAEIQDEGFNVHFYPENPIIAYRRFTLNDDNFLFLGKDSTLRAGIDLLADDGTGLKVYGEPNAEGDNDITVSVNRLNLGELSSILVWMPPLSGYLSGDFHLTDANNILSAMATVETQDFSYDSVNIGHLGSEIIYLPKKGGEHYAEAYLSYEDEEVLEAKGSYFQEGEGSFVGDVHLNQMPLSLINAFLAGTGLELSGRSEGNFHAEGPLSAPVMNGALNFSDAHALMPLYSVDFKMDTQPVNIRDSRLNFKEFALRSAGNTPLTVNGDVDASDLGDIGVNLRLKTNNFEVFNTPKNKLSVVFGKLYADMDATVKGSLNDLGVKGNINILDKTNATYILRDSPVSVDDEFADLVTFTNFKDSTLVVKEASKGTAVDLNMAINISDAAKFHCLLSEKGDSYVDVMGGGDLGLRYNRQGQMLLTGRYTIEEGEMKYELPVIPLRTFTITQGSYVEFTGDMMNPTLAIKATENTRASVNEDGAQRSVRFIAGVDISQTLNNMGLEFTLEAPDDGNIQNELAAMTPLQRNKTAVALMATGMYMTDDLSSLTSGFKGSNALNMFLQNSIQSIAGNALGSVDLNFDVGSNTTQTGGTTTDYSFQFAKRFWGDRIAVILGGKVSTGAEASNTAASIIDNISVEYRLDKGATRYVRLFYDRSAHDALEGNLMETGAGLVLRKKTNKLGELFLFRR